MNIYNEYVVFDYVVVQCFAGLFTFYHNWLNFITNNYSSASSLTEQNYSNCEIAYVVLFQLSLHYSYHFNSHIYVKTLIKYTVGSKLYTTYPLTTCIHGCEHSVH